MIVACEGCDCSGKTTLWRELCERLPWAAHVKYRSPRGADFHQQAVAGNMCFELWKCLYDPDKLYVCDRFGPVTSAVYDSVFDREPSCEQRGFWDKDLLVLFLDPGDEELLRRRRARGAEEFDDEALLRVAERYRQVIRDFDHVQVASVDEAEAAVLSRLKYAWSQGSWYRPGTVDLNIRAEQPEWCHLDIRSDDVVLDLGAHAGYFAQWCPARSIGVEPDAENARLYRMNNPNGTLIQAAVGSDAIYVDSDPRLTYKRSAQERPGSRVRVQKVDLAGLLACFKPTVVKVDVEGSESLPGFWDGDWSGVRSLGVEFHGGWEDRVPRGFKRVGGEHINKYNSVVVTRFYRKKGSR